MAEAVATQCIKTEAEDVRCQDDRTDAYAEMLFAVSTEEPHCVPRIVGEEKQEDQSEIQKIAMDVLDNEREPVFAAIAFARFADGAGDRVGPHGFVVGSAIVIASETKSAGSP